MLSPNTLNMYLVHKRDEMSNDNEVVFGIKNIQIIKKKNSVEIDRVRPCGSSSFIASSSSTLYEFENNDWKLIYDFHTTIDCIAGNEAILFAILDDNTCHAIVKGEHKASVNITENILTAGIASSCQIINQKLYIVFVNGIVQCASFDEKNNVIDMTHIRLRITVTDLFIASLGDILFYNETQCVITEDGMINADDNQFQTLKPNTIAIGLIHGHVCIVSQRSADMIKNRGFQFGCYTLTEEKEDIIDAEFSEEFVMLYLLDNTYICLRGSDIQHVYTIDASLFTSPTFLSVRSDGQMLFVSEEHVYRLDGTCNNARFEFLSEIDDWVAGKIQRLTLCLSLGTQTTERYLSMRIKEWFFNVPDVDSATDLYTMCNTSNVLLNAFAEAAADYIVNNIDSSTTLSRIVWRNQFKIIHEIADKMPDTLLSHIQTTLNPIVLVELALVFGAQVLLTTDIITDIITKLHLPLQREMALMVLKTQNSYPLVDSMARAAQMESIFNIFSIVDTVVVMQSVSRGYYDDWMGALQHTARFKGISTHMQHIFDTILQTHVNNVLSDQECSFKRILQLMKMSTMNFHQPSKSLHGKNCAFQIDAETKGLLYNYALQAVEDSVRNSLSLSKNDLNTYLKCLCAQPIFPAAEALRKERITCIHPVLHGLAVAADDGTVRILKYIGATLEQTIASNIDVQCMASSNKFLYASGIRASDSNSRSVIAVFDTISGRHVNEWTTTVPLLHMHCTRHGFLFVVDAQRRILLYNKDTGYMEKQVRSECTSMLPIRIFFTGDVIVEATRQSVYRFVITSRITCAVQRLRRKADFVIPLSRPRTTLFVQRSGKIVLDDEGVVTKETIIQAGLITNVMMWSSDFAILTTRDGEIIIMNVLKMEIWHKITLPSMPILHGVLSNNVLFVVTPTTIMSLLIDPWRYTKTVTILGTLASLSSKLQKSLALRIESLLPPADILQMKKAFTSLVDVCSKVKSKEMQSWRNEQVISKILRNMSCSQTKSNDIMMRLFNVVTCSNKATFKCAICQRTRVDSDVNKIGILPCFHKFHYRCIESLVVTHPEVNEECLQEYALSVQLNCPLCRTKFKNMEDVKFDDDLNSALLNSGSSSDESDDE